MFGSKILDVAIGLTFVYLLSSLVCLIINEWIAKIFTLRARTLEKAIRNLLGGKAKNSAAFLKEFYEHPVIKGLSLKGKPSYIPPQEAARVLMDILMPVDKASGSQTVDKMRKTVSRLPDGDVRIRLLTFMTETEKNVENVRGNIERWFNEVMDRATGWYTRKLQAITLCVALLVAVGLNIDTFAIANSLYRDDVMRTSVAAAAVEVIEQQENIASEISMKNIRILQDSLQHYNLPVGWSDASGASDLPRGLFEWLSKIVGWLFTALAVSLGAPFWFDMLGKLVNIRSSGKKPEPADKNK